MRARVYTRYISSTSLTWTNILERKHRYKGHNMHGSSVISLQFNFVPIWYYLTNYNIYFGNSFCKCSKQKRHKVDVATVELQPIFHNFLKCSKCKATSNTSNQNWVKYFFFVPICFESVIFQDEQRSPQITHRNRIFRHNKCVCDRKPSPSIPRHCIFTALYEVIEIGAMRTCIHSFILGNIELFSAFMWAPHFHFKLNRSAIWP